MKVVIALGGNALLQRGEPVEADLQKENVARAAAVIARLVAVHTVVVTHGNGPQIGLLALQSEAYREVKPYPLDVLGAQSEGMIGYLIELELQKLLPKRHVVTLLTQVEVSAADPAFKHPAHPIGPALSEDEAKRLAGERGWAVAPDGPKWRRIVPGPEPLRIRELAAIRLLMSAGAIVICAGGGGIPVVASGGRLHGVEAVIDKDLAAALLAHHLGAEALLLLTDVDAVVAGWGTPQQHAVRETTPRELRRYAFHAGTMKPKVEAACRFVESGGKLAGIGRLEDALVILQGARGTVIRPDPLDSLDFTPAQAGAAAAPGRPEPFPPVAEPEWVPFELPENAPPPKPRI
jgi:carbamate kinase